MEINEALKMLSECSVIIGMSNEGTMKLIKNNSNNEIRCLGDGLNILFNLFNQETQFEYFNEAFKVDFEKLILNHMKRMEFDGCKIISTEEGLWASAG